MFLFHVEKKINVFVYTAIRKIDLFVLKVITVMFYVGCNNHIETLFVTNNYNSNNFTPVECLYLIQCCLTSKSCVCTSLKTVIEQWENYQWC